MKKILILLTILGLFGCSSNKTISSEGRNFVSLDSIGLANKFKDYTLDVPDNWYSYLGLHESLMFSPKKLINENLGFYLSFFGVGEHGSFDKKVTKELFLKSELERSKKINHQIIKRTHPLYGEYFVISRSTNLRGEVSQRRILTILITNKEKHFTLVYSSSGAYYEKYLIDVFKMIESFRIK
ncbi:MAG: PsbP-related protein [Polaribacter sp.]|nr:PsbP-related protein [Polaribacter sp.]